MTGSTDRYPVLRVRHGRVERRVDTLVTEQPLELRVDGTPVAVTMRTPGHDLDLALGFLLTEGLIHHSRQVGTVRDCPAGTAGDGRAVDVHLAERPGAELAAVRRQVYTTSSCGVCGKASIDAVRTRTHWPVADDPVQVDPVTLARLPELLVEAQRVFHRTGGLHAAGLFSAAGELLVAREDVGRHNAVDKVVGWALRGDRLPLHATVLLVSGRASFEMVQKALMAGVPVLAAVSAPSALAVQLAAEAGMTVVGFLRGDSFNVYAGEWRLALPSGDRIGQSSSGMS